MASLLAAAFSPDSKLVLTGPRLGLWDVDSGKKVRDFATGGAIIGFLPGGKRGVARDAYGLQIWDVKEGKKIRYIEKPKGSDIHSSTLSPDGKTVLLGCMSGEVMLLDLASGKASRTFKMHQSWVSVVTFSPDGTKVLSADSDVLSSPADRERANPKEVGLKLWRIDTGEVIHCFRHADGWLWAVSNMGPHGREAFSQNGKLVLSNLTNSKEGKLFRLGHTNYPYLHVFVWEASSGKVLEEVPIGDGGAYGIGLSPDGKKVWLLGLDGTLHLWDRGCRKEAWAIKVIEPGESPGLAVLSPDRKLLLTAPAVYRGTSRKDPDIVLKVWDSATGKLVRALRGPVTGPYP
jgi:WD40 repeat protein